MLVSKGNHKLGTDTLIFNMTSASDCPSKALGLCKLPAKCYAMKAEKMYKAVLPYRRRQAEYWDQSTAETIAADLRALISRSKGKVKYIRFSEAGDFRSQEDVTKMYKVAELIEDTGVMIYGYTARADLQFPFGPKNLTIQGSGFMLDNSFTAVSKLEFDAAESKCAGNCRECHMCKAHNKLDIKVAYH